MKERMKNILKVTLIAILVLSIAPLSNFASETLNDLETNEVKTSEVNKKTLPKRASILDPTNNFDIRDNFIPSVIVGNGHTTEVQDITNQYDFFDGNVIHIASPNRGVYQHATFTSKNRYDLTKGGIVLDVDVMSQHTSIFGSVALAFHDTEGYQFKAPNGAHPSETSIYSEINNNLDNGVVVDYDEFCNRTQTVPIITENVAQNVGDYYCRADKGGTSGVDARLDAKVITGNVPNVTYPRVLQYSDRLDHTRNVPHNIRIVTKPLENNQMNIKAYYDGSMYIDTNVNLGTDVVPNAFLTMATTHGDQTYPQNTNADVRINEFQYVGVNPQIETTVTNGSEVITSGSDVVEGSTLHVNHKVTNDEDISVSVAAIINQQNIPLENITNLTIDGVAIENIEEALNGNIQVPIKPTGQETNIAYDVIVPPTQTISTGISVGEPGMQIVESNVSFNVVRTTFDVVYKGNVAGVEDVTQRHNIADGLTLANNPFTNSGYQFVAWGNTSDYTNVYTEGINISDVTPLLDRNNVIELGAIWAQINANNFMVTPDFAKTLTAQQVESLSSATVVSEQKPDLSLVVNQEDVNKINSGKLGVYPVTISLAQNPNVSKVIYVLVGDELTMVGDNNAIRANNFTIKLSEVLGTNTLTADEAITLADVNVWAIPGGITQKQIDAPVIVDETQLQAINNATSAQVLPLTFSVEGDANASTTVDVTIIDNTQIILPGQDDNMDTEDDVLVKPNPDQDGNYPDKNPGGSVDLPNGGDITFPNNPDNNGTVTVPGGSTVAPDGTITTPEGGIVKPNPDGTITLPGQDGNLGTDDDVIVKPGGNGDATIKPDGSVDLPNGGDVSFPGKPDAGMEVPGGSNVGQDGTVTAPNGDQSRPNVDGTITVPGHDGNFGTEDDGIIKPNGPNKPVLNEDGTITLPDGGVITFPGLGDCEIVIEPTGYVDSRGVVTNPGADGIINTADDEVIDPAVVCAIKPTVTPEQPRPTNTGAMNNMIMLLLVVAVSSVVVIGLRSRK